MSPAAERSAAERSAAGPKRPAATLVLLRPRLAAGPGFEILLTRRPDSMRFGGGLYVFPGGRVERGETARRAAVRETAEETGIDVAPSRLIALTRWVTPQRLPYRFDARFYGTVVPAATDVADASDEVAAWSWLDPTSALEGMAAGRLPMWQPTVVTLQQLEAIGSAEELRAAFRPGPGSNGAMPAGSRIAHQVETAWAGGIRGRRGSTWAIGESAWVVVDPPDPTDATIATLLEAATAADATLAGVVIRDLAPEHHAGVELFARGLGLPVAGPPGVNALVPYDVIELSVGHPVPFGDSGLRVAEIERWDDRPAGSLWAGRAGRLRLEAS